MLFTPIMITTMAKTLTNGIWRLFQYEGQDHLSFIIHSIMAVELLVDNISKSLLLFSGSQTKKEAGNMSEAQSYYLQIYKLLNAVHNNAVLPSALLDLDDILTPCRRIIAKLTSQDVSLADLFQEHISTEEFALDSFENLIYTMGRFYEITNDYPEHISIVGFKFKESRFLQYHAAAIDFPKDEIHYISVDPQPPYSDAKRLNAYFDDLHYQEKKNALDLFKTDWYGTKNPLIKKKIDRNPFKRKHQYPLPVSFEGPIADDEKFFETYVKHKMPWSKIPNQQ